MHLQKTLLLLSRYVIITFVINCNQFQHFSTLRMRRCARWPKCWYREPYRCRHNIQESKRYWDHTGLLLDLPGATDSGIVTEHYHLPKVAYLTAPGKRHSPYQHPGIRN